MRIKKIIIFSLLVGLTVGGLFLLKKEQARASLVNGESSLRFNVYQDYVEAIRLNGEDDYKVWESEEGIEKIDQAILFDHDQDGRQELIILYWRYGDYFAKRDDLVPIRGDDQLSQHINIYELEPYVNLVWGGSSLEKPIVDLEICLQDKNLLCAGESTYDAYPKKHKDLRIQWAGWWWEVI